MAAIKVVTSLILRVRLPSTLNIPSPIRLPQVRSPFILADAHTHTMRVFILFLIGLTLSAALIDHETKEEFKDFLQKFGKHYDNPVEYAKRLAIYAKNKAERIAHNLKVSEYY